MATKAAKTPVVFPVSIYVIREEDGPEPEDSYLVCYTDLKGIDHGKLVATYALSSQNTLELAPRLLP